MPSIDFSLPNIIGNVLFSAVGFVAFTYGKRMGLLTLMLNGAALMAFPYFVSDTFWMYAVGAGLTFLAWQNRRG